MCEHHHHATSEIGDHSAGSRRAAFDRRTLLKAAAATPFAAGLAGSLGNAPSAAAASIDGAFSMAMHIHSSFSEGAGTMDGHLNQATANGVDVIWWTDHSWRMQAVAHAPNVVHFTSLTTEKPTGQQPIKWTTHKTGSLTTASTGGIASTPASPLDPVAKGSLRVAAQSKGTALASFGFLLKGNRTPWRTNLTQQQLAVEVMPVSIGRDGFLQITVETSNHPAINGRTGGKYTLQYQIGGTQAPGTIVVNGLVATVSVACVPNQWNSLALTPQNDIAAAWPDLDSRDFTLFNLTFAAVSRKRALASGFFDYLRFNRGSAGEVALSVQDQMMTDYASRYPLVTQHHGTEVSDLTPHVNWFGGNVALPDTTGQTARTWSQWLAQTVIPAIHTSGGLASYNHPFGSSGGAALPVSSMDALTSSVATGILTNGALGADIIEVGYQMRAGVDLAHHAAVWDICSRNALFLTGNGVTDDHDGNNWYSMRPNNWTTSAWAADTQESSLLDALRAGRCWFNSLSGYQGALDLVADTTCPMGSVSVSDLLSRSLQITATAVPTGGKVEVVQGGVDYAGTADPRATSAVVATVPADALVGGTFALPVDTSASSFVRTQVRDSTGKVVAMSNPLWLLRDAPPSGVPDPRAA